MKLIAFILRKKVFIIGVAFTTVKIEILVIPPYSVVSWISKKGAKISKAYYKQHLELLRRISVINEYIQSVNDYLRINHIDLVWNL